MFLKLIFENIFIGLCAQGPKYVVMENTSLEHKVQSSHPLCCPSTFTTTQLLYYNIKYYTFYFYYYTKSNE